MSYSELVDWAKRLVNDDVDDGFLEKWYAKLSDKDTEIDNLAIWLAKEFIDRIVDFEVASTIFNQVMPVVGFDSAPKIFWKFYVAFEDFENSNNPDEEARPRIKEELNQLNQ